MRNRFASTFLDCADGNPDLHLIVADISPAGSIAEFRERYPQRFINTGVAEQVMIGMAAGMAQANLRVFCYTIATFALYRPFEFIRDDLCYQDLPVTVVGIGGGVTYSTLGATHHAMEDVAIAWSIPNMQVIAPCDPLEVEEATKWCASQSRHPTYLRLGKAGEPILTAEAPPWEFGKLRMIRSGGGVFCILAYGPIMSKALELAERIDATVYSVHTLAPLDEDKIKELIDDFSHVIVLEEMVSSRGLGLRVKALAWETQSHVTVIDTFGLKHKFIHAYGDHADLLREHGLTIDQFGYRF